MMPIRISQKAWIYLGPLFVIIGAGLWGTESYFRINLNARFNSEILVFHEHLFCILFTLPFIFTSPFRLKDIPRRAWIYLLLSGTVGSAIGTVFFTMSLKELNPSVANVLLNFQPLVSVFFARVCLNEHLGQRFLFWGALALIFGAVLASDQANLQDISLNTLFLNKGLLYITITAFAWGFSTVAGRGAMIDMPLQVATLGRFIIGALAIFISLNIKGQFTPELLKWNDLTDSFIVENFIWLSLIAGVVPLFFYFQGLKKTSASVGGFCELTQTFTALLLTWGIMGHALTLKQILAGVGLIYAVFRINLNYARANEQRI